MQYRPTVLVADDCRTFSKYMSLLLGRMGLDAVPAFDGDDAVRLSKVFRPDVIMLDIEMPVMDGIKTLRYLKLDEETKEIPVIMVSVSADDGLRDKCTALGCMTFMTKPVSLTHLHDALHARLLLQGGCRRKHLRSAWDEPLPVTIEGLGAMTCRATVLSEGGVYLACERPHPARTKVVVSLPLSDGVRVDVKGHVVYTEGVYHGGLVCAEPGMAVAFDDFPLRHAVGLREKILNLLLQDIDPSHVVARLDS